MGKRIHSSSSWNGCKQTAALFAIAVFSVQLVRFYVAVPSDALTCNELGHHHGAAGEMANHMEHSDQQLASTGDPDQSYFQHCKETLDYVCLAPAQPFGMPVFVAHRMEPRVALIQPAQNAAPIDNALPPPFQPPRDFN